VFLSQGIQGTPRAVMAMEGLQAPMEEEAQAALARPLAYIAPSAVMAQLAEGANVSAAQPVALENVERAVPALRSLDNMVATLLQLGTEGLTAQAAEALQAERGGALALPQFSEALRQLQVRNVQPGQALTAEVVTPQAAPAGAGQLCAAGGWASRATAGPGATSNGSGGATARAADRPAGPGPEGLRSPACTTASPVHSRATAGAGWPGGAGRTATGTAGPGATGNGTGSTGGAGPG